MSAQKIPHEYHFQLMQKMEHLEADFNQKLAVLEEQQKSSSDLVTEGNANKAILEKLKDAIAKAEENIQKNQQKIGEHFKEVVTQNRMLTLDNQCIKQKLEEAEQKAEMAKSKVNLFRYFGVRYPFVRFSKNQTEIAEMHWINMIFPQSGKLVQVRSLFRSVCHHCSEFRYSPGAPRGGGAGKKVMVGIFEYHRKKVRKFCYNFS
jgi:regulator of replication initiation timing